ncbi:cell division protein ZipA C-terminal FtsZ-binding domain-containing protein [Collimonas pratensis]|uniref:Cell division protein ZipA n=1 Tax=Collimonas pratensis TaxID=279113 RepID=A0A127R156_9BURK|nr:cell division protein ZipA C-terminal FtsZ-binding domain-containing protein [Collimonas pratensis]AMP06059.1 zipA, C-terminal FtsZ-binding domain protein [Collimonas pratensis]AMP15996.1 zipA, C-terminal FtsZ-binding domain protein [Collimonas pratensis]NKI70345.1 cell division protein [Collimonas pratensis]
MTDLQTSLFIIGGAFLVGVISYNKWQEYKAKKSVERAFSGSHDDVLMTPKDGGEAPVRHEPKLFESELESELDGRGDARQAAAAHDDIEQSAEQQALEPQYGAPVASAPVAAPAVRRDLPVDELIDCAIPLALEAPVRGDKILPALQSLRHVGNKPIHFIGEDANGDWEPVAHGGVYSTLLAGVQLANRTNPLNEIEYSELVSRLRQIADDLGAEPDLPDMMEVMHTARSLHQFVIEHDAQLGVNIQSNGAPWAISTLQAALTRQGFDARPEGRMVMSDGDGGLLFSLSTNASAVAETTSRLTLLLDVPRVAPDRDGYGAMVACGRSLAARLGGVLVDDSNQPLADVQLAEIAGQVDAFYREMDAAEIPAGSVRALRLFS